MKPTLIALLIANLFVTAPLASAADGGLTWTGSAGLGLRAVKDKASDPSKLNEYRDLGSSPGVIGIFDVRAQGDSHYLNVFGENLGYNDQYIDVWGGQYGVFKYQIYGNELRHNFGSGVGARTPYAGAGSPTLTATFPSLNPATWNTFDNSYDRQDIGASFEWTRNSPWYFRADGNQVRRNGIKNISGSQGTSPGNGFVELPSPVDYTTQNMSLEAGYQSKERHLSVNWMRSQFSNENQFLRWSNGFFAPLAPTNRDTTVLAPSNEFWKVGVNGNLRQLPLQSTLAGRITYGKLTNDVPVLGTMLSTGATTPSTASSSPLFHGDIVTKTASVSLTSHPQRELDTRLYWNWSRKDNNSTALTFSPTAASTLQCSGAPCVPELFNYRKNNFGAEGGYRVNSQNKLSAGYDYYDTTRERIDFDETTDHKIYVEWKNSTFDTVSGRLKYQYLERHSNFQPTTGIDAFVRRFDYANVNQHQVKLVLDANPAPLLDLGFESILKSNDYKDTQLGRTDDKRQEYYASVSYGDPKGFRVTLFGDVEFMEYNSLHRVGAGNPNPSAPPAPAAPAASTTFTWSAKNKDRNWQVGLGADWLPTERWKLNSSLIYAQTEGTVDFMTQPGTILTAPLLPIGNFDNTRRTALNLKATYKYDRQWDFTGGYAFERYRFSDIGYDNFNYIAPAATAAQNSYLTGQSAFQNYTVNIFYLMATYRF